MTRQETLARALQQAADFYRNEGRMLPWRRDRLPYHVFLSEIMLQQTRVEAVIPYYERFITLFPDVHALSNATEESVFKAWEGLGYYSRARNLLRAAKEVVQSHGGSFPESYDTLLTLPGVGKYTAGAIASLSFGIPKSAVDGNAVRIYSRLFADETNAADERFKARIAEELDAVYPEGDAAADTTQGLMEVGQRFCLPVGAPKCRECPLSGLCAVACGEDFHRYPHKKRKKARKIESLTILLMTDGNRFAIRRRPDTGLLGGLWEFPSASGTLKEAEAVSAANALGFHATGAIKAVTGKHIFTHIEWHMQSYLVSFEREAPRGFLVATYEEIKEKYPIASAFRVFLDFIAQYR